jgi:hypothetical protein
MEKSNRKELELLEKLLEINEKQYRKLCTLTGISIFFLILIMLAAFVWLVLP